MKKTIVLKMICMALLTAICTLPPVHADEMMPGKGVEVKPGRATWTTGFFLEALYSRALAESHGDRALPALLWPFQQQLRFGSLTGGQ